MGRDRRLTGPKLDRAESALIELLACADIEFRSHLERAQRAVAANRRWWQEERAAGVGVDDDEPDLGEPEPRETGPDGSGLPDPAAS